MASPEIKFVAEKFVERANALGLKGKRRDDAALDFFCGAAIGAQAANNIPLAQQIGNVAALIVAVRGAMAVIDLTKGD